jgi:transcriptional regulator with XRE-family HTH domain
MTLGDRVKARRLRLGLTQDDVARRARIRRPTITELETNRRFTVKSDVLKRLAVALQCSTDYLLETYEEEQRKPAGMALAST